MDVRLQMPRSGFRTPWRETSHPFQCHCMELTESFLLSFDVTRGQYISMLHLLRKYIVCLLINKFLVKLHCEIILHCFINFSTEIIII